MKTLTAILVFVLCVCLAGAAFAAQVVRSWDDANQRGGDLATGAGTDFDYGQLRADILARGHSVLPGISTITLANLAGVNVFFHGTSSHILSASEQAALATFVNAGGCVIIEANSDPNEQASGNSALSGLGLGSPYNGLVSGSNGSTAGLFSNNVTATTVGPLGDLRGLTFGSSLCADITTTGGTLVGTNGTVNCMVEYVVGNGRVLACGDPYGFGLFVNPTGSLYNPNNSKAYLNFIEKETGPVSVESTSWSQVKALYR